MILLQLLLFLVISQTGVCSLMRMNAAKVLPGRSDPNKAKFEAISKRLDDLNGTQHDVVEKLTLLQRTNTGTVKETHSAESTKDIKQDEKIEKIEKKMKELEKTSTLLDALAGTMDVVQKKLAALKPTVPSDPCPKSKGYIMVTSPRMCFKLSRSGDTRKWESSLLKCEAEGGRLIILNTTAKHNYIKQYLKKSLGSNYHVWLGMKKHSGVFKWNDGTRDVARGQWGKDEPDYLSYQNCVKMRPDGLTDVSCEETIRFMCEVPL